MVKSNITQQVSPETIHSWIYLLSYGDPKKRKKAHYHLVSIGKPAVPALIELLKHPQAELRRESALILGKIDDPSAIPALINLLEDDAYEVRWRAAESLIEMKRECLIPLLEELKREERYRSQRFLEGAHHILRIFDEKGYLGPSVQVLEAFESPDKEMTIPWAVEKVLEILNGGSNLESS